MDNIELESIMEKLESLADEDLAVELLKEFNDSTSKYGKLLLNQNEGLSHEQWKKECDTAKKRVDEIIARINSI